MSFTVDDLRKDIAEWIRINSDEEVETYDFEYGDSVLSYFFDEFYKQDELPTLGTIKLLDNWIEFGDGNTRHNIYEVQGRLFEITGWTNSWSGDGEWDGTLTEVEQYIKPVERYRPLTDS